MALPSKSAIGAWKAPVHREPRNVLEKKRGMEGQTEREGGGETFPNRWGKIWHGITITLLIPIKILYNPKAKCWGNKEQNDRNENLKDSKIRMRNRQQRHTVLLSLHMSSLFYPLCQFLKIGNFHKDKKKNRGKSLLHPPTKNITDMKLI